MRATGRAAIVMAATATLLGGGTASAANEFVVNDNGSAVLVDVAYARDGVDGYVYGWQQKNGDGYVSLFEMSGSVVQCAGQSTRRESDDVFGFVGSYRYGEGTGSVTTGTRYATGSLTGMVESYRDDFDECAGTYETTYAGALPVRVDVTATGPVETTRGRNGYHVPSLFNGHYGFSFTSRTATGTATIGGVASAADGQVGKTTWTYHAN